MDTGFYLGGIGLFLLVQVCFIPIPAVALAIKGL